MAGTGQPTPASAFSGAGTQSQLTPSQYQQYEADGGGPFAPAGELQSMLAQDQANAFNTAPFNNPAINPWAADTQIQSNSAFLPENYFVGGAMTGYDNYTAAGPGTAQGAGNPSAPAPGNSYPAMPNSYGLGTTPSPTSSPAGPGTGISMSMPASQSSTPGNTSTSDFATNQIEQNVEDSDSRGFNPWSMMGEANARNGQRQ